ncbi:MAG TPA: hypothetical protein VHD56_12345 [Tepidisphaeraceae bacterium]|nr:hypothetical protein [Tepidisphaeraceae bacterium]
MRRWRQIHPPPLLNYAIPTREQRSLMDQFLDVIDDLGGPTAVSFMFGVCCIFSGISLGGPLGMFSVLLGGVALWQMLKFWERSSRW